MEYSGPASIADVEADLALSDDEDITDQHWPPMELHTQCSGTTPWKSQVDVLPPATQPSTSTKRPMDQASNTSEPSSPAPKSSRRIEPLHPTAPTSSASNHDPHDSSCAGFVLPAFAPRTDYVKLIFRDNPTVDTKLRWLSDVTKAFRLDRELAEVKMSAVTSRFVYISRRRDDIIESAIKGAFLSLKLEVQDSIERPRKFATYLVTRFPVGVDPSLAKELPGVYKARRFHQYGTPINRLVITWSLPDPPPSEFTFSFLPCLPPCELRRMKDEQPWCYKCWGIGHISRYCSASSDKCGWCAGTHASRTCPHRTPSQPTTADGASTSEQPSPSTADTSMWKCPRCHEPRVNVWHGCTRRSPATASAVKLLPYAPHPSRQAPSPPSRPRLGTASHPSATTTIESPQVTALREAVAKLTARCTAIEMRFEAIDARFAAIEASMASIQAEQVAAGRTLDSLVESNHALVATVTTFSERLDNIAASFEMLSARFPEEPPRRTPRSSAALTSSSPSASRSPKGRLQ